ncbi:MAG: hypothetical protein ACP5D7_10565 [Limnospira sp.]
MTVAPKLEITLKEFLKQPETRPAREYIDVKTIRKPTQKARHSRLQNKMIQAIFSTRATAGIVRRCGGIAVLKGVEIELTCDRVFGCLKMRESSAT